MYSGLHCFSLRPVRTECYLTFPMVSLMLKDAGIVLLRAGCFNTTLFLRYVRWTSLFIRWNIRSRSSFCCKSCERRLDFWTYSDNRSLFWALREMMCTGACKTWQWQTFSGLSYLQMRERWHHALSNGIPKKHSSTQWRPLQTLATR